MWQDYAKNMPRYTTLFGAAINITSGPKYFFLNGVICIPKHNKEVPV